MKHIICAVYDEKAQAFGRPFFTQTTGIAVRSFTEEINSNNPESMPSKYPKDFILYELGTFDDRTATFESQKPKVLINGNQVKEVKNDA